MGTSGIVLICLRGRERACGAGLTEPRRLMRKVSAGGPVRRLRLAPRRLGKASVVLRQRPKLGQQVLASLVFGIKPLLVESFATFGEVIAPSEPDPGDTQRVVPETSVEAIDAGVELFGLKDLLQLSPVHSPTPSRGPGRIKDSTLRGRCSAAARPSPEADCVPTGVPTGEVYLPDVWKGGGRRLRLTLRRLGQASVVLRQGPKLGQQVLAGLVFGIKPLHVAS